MVTKSKNLEVHSNHKDVAEIIEEGINKLDTDELFGSPRLIFRDLREKLWTLADRYVAMKEPTSLKVTYNGKRSVNLQIKDFKLLDPYLYSHDVYYHSNEFYSPYTVKDMELTYGINSYVGIPGGLTQVISQLIFLNNGNNDIRNVTLYDINQNQLFLNTLQLIKLAKQPDYINPLMYVRPNKPLQGKDGSYEIYKLPQKINFVLKNNDIREGLRKASDKGKYFIYTSNAFEIKLDVTSSISEEAQHFECRNDLGWYKWPAGYEVLQAISNNENIKNGSMYLSASVESTKALIMEKQSNKMLLYSYSDGGYGTGGIHPSLVIKKDEVDGDKNIVKEKSLKDYKRDSKI